MSDPQVQDQIVTLLFTDIEGSTRLWESDPRGMSVALGRHDALLHTAIESAGGRVFKTAGDAFCAIFSQAADAIQAAAAGQRALVDEARERTTLLRVRMAIHAGPVEARGGDYFGPPLNRVARLLASAHGEQILVSRAAADLTRGLLPADLGLRNLGEHALKDLQQSERVFQVIAPGLRADFPPLRAPRQSLRNFPRPATPLIGREEEIAAASSLFGLQNRDSAGSEPPSLADLQGVRLLTVTGPGGAGKTRLAVHLASTLGGEFEDGAAFVSLAELTDPSLAPVAIASVFDLGDGGGDSPRDLLAEYLRDRHVLLVLDNFEQVMGAAELVSDLLTHCPRLRVLVTSRERLSLRGEQDFPLQPLALPAAGTSAVPGGESGIETPLTLDDIGRSEAVRLFVERARAVKPGFALSADNADAVGDICRRLDGLPLAIELAAARIRFHSPQGLLDRFDHRLDVLSRGHRDLPARQQTMRDTIAWSYDLLDPAEQRMFTCLSVFVGGATLEGVEHVGGREGDAALRGLVESLADKSLIQLVADDDEQRVMMLQTIRDFGQERLAENRDRRTIAQRHAEYFLRFAEEAEPMLAGKEQKSWLDLLDREQANLRAAIGWLRGQGQTQPALRLGGALWRYWWLRGDMDEGRSHLEALLQAHEPTTVAPAVRAKALNGAGVLAESQGDWETAARFHQESLGISKLLGNAEDVAWSLNNLGVVSINQGDYERAAALLEEGLDVAEKAADAASTAATLIDLAQIANYQGDHDRATGLLTRSLTLLRALGNESQLARALNNLGAVAIEQGNLERAQSLLTESLALHRRVGDRQGIASTLNNLGEVVSGLGDHESAMGLYLESHLLALQGGNRLYAAIALENLAALTQRRGDERTAQLRFREALALFRSVGDRQGICACLGGLATAAAAHGYDREAATMLGAVAGIGASPGQPAIALPGLDETVQSLRAVMGNAAFDSAWEAGKTMPIDAVVDEVAAHGLSLETRGAT